LGCGARRWADMFPSAAFGPSRSSRITTNCSRNSWKAAKAGKCPPRWHLSVCSEDRKSTRLNSSHLGISYAVFCLKKKISLAARRHQLCKLLHILPLHSLHTQLKITTSSFTTALLQSLPFL